MHYIHDNPFTFTHSRRVWDFSLINAKFIHDGIVSDADKFPGGISDYGIGD